MPDAIAAPVSPPPRPPRPRRRWGWWLGMVLVAGGLGLWQGWPRPGQGYRFETVALDRGAIQRAVSATGSVQALVTVQIGSQLSGQVAEVRADFNSRVSRGDLLALIDPKTFRSKVVQAEADLRVAQAGVAVREAEIRRAQAQVRLKTQDLARQRALARSANVSQSALEAAETEVVQAEADLAVAHAQRDNARALVAQKEAALAQARIDLERTEIRSSINGVVIDRSVDPGQTVAASLQAPVLFRIAQDLAEIQIEAKVNEADIGDIREDQPVTFTVDAYPERRFSGQVRQKRLAAETANNVVTYTVIIQAANPDRILLPGMTATAEILTGQRDAVPRLPNEALRFAPPAGAKLAEGEGARQGGGRERLLQELGERLTLSEAQRQAIAAGLGGAGSGGGGGGSDRGSDAARPDPEARRQRLENLLRRHLNGEQWAAYEAWRAERGESSSGRVWLLDAKGALESRRVRLGIADNRYTELVSGSLQEGDAVVTRALKAEQP